MLQQSLKIADNFYRDIAEFDMIYDKYKDLGKRTWNDEFYKDPQSDRIDLKMKNETFYSLGKHTRKNL